MVSAISSNFFSTYDHITWILHILHTTLADVAGQVTQKLLTQPNLTPIYLPSFRIYIGTNQG